MASADETAPQLIVTDPPHKRGLVLPLSAPEVLIGHSDTADLGLDDEYVSRRHALVTVEESGVVTIRDLKSTAGTFVNEERLEGRRVLKRGDLVRFADPVARFEPGGTAGDPAASLGVPGGTTAAGQAGRAAAAGDSAAECLSDAMPVAGRTGVSAPRRSEALEASPAPSAPLLGASSASKCASGFRSAGGGADGAPCRFGCDGEENEMPPVSQPPCDGAVAG